MDKGDQGMDKRDKQDREEWEKRQRGSATQNKSKAAPKPPPRPDATDINWSAVLNRKYRIASIRSWLSRCLGLCFLAGIFYVSAFFAIPWITNYAEGRYNEHYHAPFYFCDLKGSDALYEKSDLFKDYYNFRLLEMRLYQHAVWELDGTLRQAHPDKAFVLEIPSMPAGYNTDQEFYKTYRRFIHPEKSLRFVFDVKNNKAPLKIMNKDEVYCSLPSASSTKPQQFTEYVTYWSDEIGSCRTCK